MSEATASDPEISLFASWLRDGTLPVDSNELTRYDPITKNLHAQWERYKLNEGVLYRKYWENHKDAESWQLVPPLKYRTEIVNTAHSSVTGGHMGVRRTQIKVAKRAYWVKWSCDVRDVIRKCDVCARYHRRLVRKQGELQNMCVGAPWERVAINVTGPHPQSSQGTNSW